MKKDVISALTYVRIFRYPRLGLELKKRNDKSGRS